MLYHQSTREPVQSLAQNRVGPMSFLWSGPLGWPERGKIKGQKARLDGVMAYTPQEGPGKKRWDFLSE